MNHKYLFDKNYDIDYFDYNTFKNIITILIKRTTGTGKTTSTTKHI